MLTIVQWQPNFPSIQPELLIATFFQLGIFHVNDLWDHSHGNWKDLLQYISFPRNTLVTIHHALRSSLSTLQSTLGLGLPNQKFWEHWSWQDAHTMKQCHHLFSTRAYWLLIQETSQFSSLNWFWQVLYPAKLCNTLWHCLWEFYLPFKPKFFIWKFIQECLYTQLKAKTIWHSMGHCNIFPTSKETLLHLFLLYPFATWCWTDLLARLLDQTSRALFNTSHLLIPIVMACFNKKNPLNSIWLAVIYEVTWALWTQKHLAHYQGKPRQFTPIVTITKALVGGYPLSIVRKNRNVGN